MAKKQIEYLAYLLRMWRVKEKGETVWRASLQSPQTREHKGFANLDALFDFLLQQMDALSNSDSEQIDDDRPADPNGLRDEMV